jgi:hypothetical protein
MNASRVCLPKMRYALALTDARTLHALSFQHAKFAMSALRRARMNLRIERSRGMRQVGGLVPRESPTPPQRIETHLDARTRTSMWPHSLRFRRDLTERSLRQDSRPAHGDRR